ncbi:MAG: hypothetical protein ACYTFG_00320 [Planctomycetota bacterium]|jgi:hypothetical protein
MMFAQPRLLRLATSGGWAALYGRLVLSGDQKGSGESRSGSRVIGQSLSFSGTRKQLDSSACGGGYPIRVSFSKPLRSTRARR